MWEKLGAVFAKVLLYVENGDKEDMALECNACVGHTRNIDNDPISTLERMGNQYAYMIDLFQKEGRISTRRMVYYLKNKDHYKRIEPPTIDEEEKYDFIFCLRWSEPKAEENGVWLTEQNQQRRKNGKKHWTKTQYRMIEDGKWAGDWTGFIKWNDLICKE
ncbi:MAG: hypothetical protein IJV56_01155 [Neisseriaceae bacterium]|nr:hypothetical protein [Neisseriaceae bacterium]